jgi:hypothetical protein
MAAYNPNYVGGDINTGANTARQIALRPRLAINPYTLGMPGVYPALLRDSARCWSPRHVRPQRCRGHHQQLPSEKRKVGGSTPPLTTTSQGSPLALSPAETAGRE